MSRICCIALLAFTAAATAGGHFYGDGGGRPDMPPYQHEWMERIRDWESVMPELRGFHMLLDRLDLTSSQHRSLNSISERVQDGLDELREDYDLGGTRRAVFEAFVDDMYMTSSVEMAIWDRQWFQQGALGLVTDAMGEIHEMLSEEQLRTARDIIRRLPDLGPAGGRGWPADGRWRK